MLASTVQFSTYGQSPHIPHRQTPTNAGRYDEHEALQRKQSPVPSGPNSVPTTSPPTHPRSRPSPTQTRDQQAVLASKHKDSAELVSVPPSSSATNTRTHPELGELHGPRTALDHHHDGGGQCSLERR